MKKDVPKLTRTGRLIRSMEARRAHATEKNSPIPTVESQAASRTKKSLIKYPNSAGALRQQVEKLRADDIPRPPIRLRLRVPQEPGRAADARRASSKSGERQLAAPGGRTVSTRVAPMRRLAPPGEPTPIGTTLGLGDVARHARRRQGLTQAELATEAGTGRRFISDLEAGKPTVEFERLLKVCAALGITLLASETQR